MLTKIKYLLQLFWELPGIGWKHLQLIRSVKNDRLTYLSLLRLIRIHQSVRQIEDKKLPGIFVEAGCALGGSAIVIANSKAKNRPLEIYDVFDQIPPPTAEDPPEVHERYKTIASGQSKGIGSDRYYGYQKGLEAKVHDNLSAFGFPPDLHSISTHVGLVQEQLNGINPVAFAHIDVDWHAPVSHCLENLFPRLMVGGSIILDDYNDWGGCKKATDAFLAKQHPNTFQLSYTKEALKITKIDYKVSE